MKGVVNKTAILPRSFKAGEEWQAERGGSGEFFCDAGDPGL